MPLTRPKLSPDAFVEWENAQPDRRFFFRGEVFACSPGSA